MNQQLDRLYELLPAFYRDLDAKKDYPLLDLLRVIAEQVNLVEGDIDQLYRNWFIETCQEWAIPYIGDLIGYRLVPEAGETGDPNAPPVDKMILIPRREVANIIRYRRRKGTLPLLKGLARSVAGWYAQTEEIPSIPSVSGTDRMDSQIAEMANPAAQDSASQIAPAPHPVPRVHLKVWRLKTYKVDRTRACCVEEHGNHCYTFSTLGNDTPLYHSPKPEIDPAHISETINLPVAIARDMLGGRTSDDQETMENDYYGQDRSLAIWAPGWPREDAPQPIRFHRIIPTSLKDWQQLPPEGHVAVDPELGRFAFPPTQLPPGGVWVSYHYAFSDDIGGGAYERPLAQSADSVVYRVVRQSWIPPIELKDDDPEHGLTGAHHHPAERRVCHSIHEALANWEHEHPKHAVIEIATNRVYEEPVFINLDEGQSLQLRAANGYRPVIRLPERRVDRPDDLTVRMASGSHFTLDGLLITGRGVWIQDRRVLGRPRRAAAVEERYREWEPFDEHPASRDPWGNRLTPDSFMAQGQLPVPPQESKEKIADEQPMLVQSDVTTRSVYVAIRHCTLVPGSTLEPDCTPGEPKEASLELALMCGKVAIEHSILGSIQVTHNEVKEDPLAIEISDSILDATEADCDGPECEALGAPGRPLAHAILTIRRCTVFGRILTHAIVLAENSIFMGRIQVARRQIGCMRFCYVTLGPDSRTPRRYHCEPDWSVNLLTPPLDESKRMEVEKGVRPVFSNMRYGKPGYCQLASQCSDEIRRGAEDGSEMGVFHDLYQPQRETNLRARLDEYVPADMGRDIIFVN